MTNDTPRGDTPRADDAPKDGALSADGAERLKLHQSNERTLLAWIRSGIALMAFGFAITRFGILLQQMAKVGHAPEDLDDGHESAWIGALLVAFGMVANLAATLRYASARRDIARGNVGTKRDTLVFAFGALATLIGAGMTFLLVRALGE